MLRKNISIIFLIILLLIFKTSFADDYNWQPAGAVDLNIKYVLLDDNQANIIYIASDKGVFKTEDSGSSWRNILSVRGESRIANFLLFDPKNKNCLYAAASGGVFYTLNEGGSWKRIFHGRNSSENQCLALAILPTAIYLGTKAGLFISYDNGLSWQRAIEKLGNSSIYSIACDSKEPNNIYVVATDAVYRSLDSGQTWEKVFFMSALEPDNKEEEINEDGDEERRGSKLNYIAIDQNNSNFLYLATASGIYYSQDKGKTWNLFNSYGLLDQNVKFILVSRKSDIYAVTKTGIFIYQDNRWQELSLRLAVKSINAISINKEDILYAGCERGLFQMEPIKIKENNQSSLTGLYYQNEPAVGLIQQAAIQYAELRPEKIINWRKQAAKKAWLPKVSVGAGRNVTDLWHWETGSTTRNDDDVLRRGNDAIEWDASLSWDLGELIWNSDQTSIDARSRLMVELRDDIVDEVTKLYFERLRVKKELDELSIEDRKKRFEKELRLDELTAQIDGLTGGYLSQQLKSSKS